MMTFLTSSIGGSYKKNGIRVPAKLCEDNGLLKNLQKIMKEKANVLILVQMQKI